MENLSVEYKNKGIGRFPRLNRTSQLTII